MNEVYINLKNFNNYELSEMFKKDLVSVEELVDKIYELKDLLDLTNDELEEAQEELKSTKRELNSAKLGFKPSDDDFAF